MRGETAVAIFDSIQAMISIHSPHARGDSSSCVVIVHQDYFNPLPSCEGRLGALDAEYNPIEFQSTPLMRGETLSTLVGIVSESNFNPLPSCEGRQVCQNSMLTPPIFQSTPLMRGESFMLTLPRLHNMAFQSTPLMRGETIYGSYRVAWNKFQSTPLMRGETQTRSGHPQSLEDFNPLPSCEGRRTQDHCFQRSQKISIHSPHARGDRSLGFKEIRNEHFNPLPSCEGRPTYTLGITAEYRISIHSPHARGDALPTSAGIRNEHFNPLPSCEGRRQYWGRTRCQ